jgi:hypothetical protein
LIFDYKQLFYLHLVLKTICSFLIF